MPLKRGGRALVPRPVEADVEGLLIAVATAVALRAPTLRALGGWVPRKRADRQVELPAGAGEQGRGRRALRLAMLQRHRQRRLGRAPRGSSRTMRR